MFLDVFVDNHLVCFSFLLFVIWYVARGDCCFRHSNFGLLSLLAILYHITTCSEISSWPCRPLSGFSAVTAPGIAGVDRAGAGVVLAHSSPVGMNTHNMRSSRLSWRCFIWSLGPKAPKAFPSWYLPSHGSRGPQCQKDRLAQADLILLLSQLRVLKQGTRITRNNEHATIHNLASMS